MKRLIITMLFALFVIAFPAMAQDVTPARLSEETTTTQEAAPTVEATQAAPVIVNVEAPETPTTPATDEGIKTIALLGWTGVLLLGMSLAYVVVLLMRELRKQAAAGDQSAKNLLGFVTATQNMLPVDELVKIIDRADARAKATPMPGEIDNAIVGQIRAYVYEILGKELNVTAPPAEPAG